MVVSRQIDYYFIDIKNPRCRYNRAERFKIEENLQGTTFYLKRPDRLHDLNSAYCIRLELAQLKCYDTCNTQEQGGRLAGILYFYVKIGQTLMLSEGPTIGQPFYLHRILF